MNILPDDTDLAESLGVRERYRVVNHVTKEFWQRWCTEVTPRLVFRQKWHEKSRNLCVGDVVMMRGNNSLGEISHFSSQIFQSRLFIFSLLEISGIQKEFMVTEWETEMKCYKNRSEVILAGVLYPFRSNLSFPSPNVPPNFYFLPCLIPPSPIAH